MNYRTTLFVALALAALLAGIFGFSHLFEDGPGKADDLRAAAEAPRNGESVKQSRHEDGDREGTESTGQSGPFQSVSRSDQSVMEDHPEQASKHQLNEAVKRLVDAGSADEMEQAIDELAVLAPELAETKRRHLYDFCNTPWDEPESVKERKQSFCQDYVGAFASGTLDTSNEELMSVNFEFRMEEEISSDLQRAPDGQVSDRFTRLVRNARFPEEVVALIAINHQRSHQPDDPFWRLGYDIWLERFPEADIVNAQEVALLLYSCMKFGGCRSDQYFTIIYCSNVLSGRCDPSANLEELLYRTRPAAEFMLAQEILLQLRASPISR